MAIKIPFDNLQELAEEDKAKTIAAQMIKSGGGFTRSLGKKLAKMNLEEIEDFKREWPSFWNQYSKIVEGEE